MKWSISHNGENGPIDLEFSGDVPNDFQKIKAEMEATQEKEGGELAEVDYIFEIPLLVAQSITGYKHDELSPHVIDDEFRIMSRARASKSKGGILSRLFGNR